MDSKTLANVADNTIKGQAINDLAEGAIGGTDQVASLRLASAVANTQTITLGTNVFEINVVATDTTHNIGEVVAGELATGVVAKTLTLTNAKAASVTKGSVLACQSEFMLVEGVVAGDTNTVVTVRRGYAGSTAATHADGQQLDEAAANVTAGRIALPTQVTVTAAAASALIPAAITAENTQGITGTRISNNEVVFSRKADGQQTTCSETLAGSNNTIDAKFHGGVEAGKGKMAIASRAPTATEVTLTNMHFVFPFNVSGAVIQANVTATGVVKLLNGAVTISGKRVSIDNSGSVNFAATDTVSVVASGNTGQAA
jgi:hypothetical protein